VVIRDFHIMHVAVMPFETNPPLIIDTDAALAFARRRQLFQAIGWRNTQIIQRLRVIQHPQLAEGNSLDFRRQVA